jgi:branched-chain amino acid transport system substrate-binding protein
VRARRIAVAAVCGLLAGGLASCGPSPAPLVVGAVYPLHSAELPAGADEFRGVRLAAEMTNEAGGVRGRQIRIVPVDVPGPDAAPAAVDLLQQRGARIVLGSEASTISVPASAQAVRRGMLYWETGAVGSWSPWDARAASETSDASGETYPAPPTPGTMPAGEDPLGPRGAGSLVFRVSPSGTVLGRSAIDFVADQLAPRMGKDPARLRFAVIDVDDVYGTTVAGGAVQEIRARGLPFAGQFTYGLPRVDAAALVAKVAATRPDVVFVVAYLDDGIAIRRQIVDQGLPLVANIGTSSSYCTPQFGEALGAAAVGVFAADKPTADSLDPAGLAPGARALLATASARYRSEFGRPMNAPALAGFSGAWALFHDVMPGASNLTPTGISAAARAQALPRGSLPNGSGLSFAPPGSPDAGWNVRAASVIWEWVGVQRSAVVWPPEFATGAIRVPGSA